MKIAKVFSCVFIFCGISSYAQNIEAPSWVDFTQKRAAGNLSEATLSDFSYTGYHFSEREIPDVSNWNTLSVVDYGAVPNDDNYDDASIQATINAAEASGVPTVVYFPAGRYVVSSEATKNSPILIRKSNIVLKGAGMGAGGTEIYSDKFGDSANSFPYRFQFAPANVTSVDITNVTSNIKKGDYEVVVANTNGLSVGQSVDLYQRNPDNIAANMPGLSFNQNWIRIINNGIRPYEKHIITAISGNTVTFKNPVQLNMPYNGTTVLKTHNTIEEVGVQDILFTSGWKYYPEIFRHHANEIVDYAWRAVYFSNVKNGWIKDCHFKDWNEMIQIERSIAVTVKDILMTGKKGHTSYYSRYSYGVLFENCVDNVSEGLTEEGKKGMLHGPGMRWSTTSSVFVNCNMQEDQAIDCHGYHPYANLLDNINGGVLLGNGGAEEAYPNSGPYLAFWNFKHEASFTSRLYDFWWLSGTSQRRTHTFAHPIFVGFQVGAGEKIYFKNQRLDELRGRQVYPNSLFDAQLQLRLYDGYMSASSQKENFKAKFANDNDNSTAWESATTGVGQWIMLDFGVQKPANAVMLNEPTPSVNNWKIDYWDETQWKPITSGQEIGANKTILFDKVTARKFRFTVESMLPGKENASVSFTQFSVLEVADPNDTDSDGIANAEDACPNTPMGAVVDAKGCEVFSLPSDNFSIQLLGESCTGKDNGQVVISADATHDYVATIDGVSYDFTDTTTLTDLAPGTYDLCISVTGKDYEQCYGITIAGGVSLSGSIQVASNSAHVAVATGTAPFTVFKNGELLFQTQEYSFSLAVSQGDEIAVNSKEACEGELITRVGMLASPYAYPNPTTGSFVLYVPTTAKEVELEVYNIYSQQIQMGRYDVSDGKVELDINNAPQGVYFVKLSSEIPVFIKIIKN